MEQSFTANAQNNNVYALCSFVVNFSEVGLLFSCPKFFCGPTRVPQELGAPVHWTA